MNVIRVWCYRPAMTSTLLSQRVGCGAGPPWCVHLAIAAALMVAGALPAAGGAIVVDHRCTDLGQVPPAAIAQAKATLRVGYGHTSHGSQLVTGLQMLAA